jgi:hypothetical protein
VAVFSPADTVRVGATVSVGGVEETGGGALDFAASAFGLRGLSHFSQRIPRVIAAPHMKHFEAMETSSGFAILRPLLVLLQRDRLRRLLEAP